MPTPRCTTLLALLTTFAAVPAVCQENYEIQVYPGLTVPRGVTMVELHSNYTSRGSPGPFGSRHALHETVEITHGFNDFFELGFYHFMAVQDETWLSLNRCRERDECRDKLTQLGLLKRS